jgi:hypothetical protein
VRQRTGATRLGQDRVRPGEVDARDLIQLARCLGERTGIRLDPGIKAGDVGGDRIDPGQHPPQQEGVVAGEVAGERLFQHGDLPAHRAPGQLGQGLGVALAGHQRGQHVPPGDPEDVGDHHAQLDLRVFEQLLDPVLLRSPGRHQVGAVPGQIPQPAELRRRHETGPDHLPLGDLAQPDRIQPVGLRPPRQVPDVLGVDQPSLESRRLQQVEHRLPVVAGCFHHHPGHPQAGQPVSHRKQRPGHRRISLHLLQPPAPTALIGHPHAAHQLGLADVQRRDPLDDLLVVLRLRQHLAHLPWIIGEGRRPQEPWACMEKSNPRARSDTERPVSWLPAPGLETTSTIKLGRRQRTAATPIFRPEPRHRRDISGLEG